VLIYIDRTVYEHIESKGLKDDEKILFTQLAFSNQRGDCFLCGDIQSLSALSKVLDKTASALFRQILANFSETKSIVSMTETLLILSYEEKTVAPEFIANKGRLVSIETAIQHNIFSQCCIIGENLQDCQFYSLLAKRYVFENQVKGITLSYHKELGGGNTINTVFKKCVEDDKILTLCIVDSDMKYGPSKLYPQNPARGETVKELETTYAQLKDTGLFEMYCLPVHEVENLIPISVLQHIAKTIPDMKSGVSFIEELRDKGLCQAILCYDFKNGDEKIKTDPAIAYWIEISEKVCGQQFPKLTGKLMPKALDFLVQKTETGSSIAETIALDSYLQSYWSDIGKKVFSWGCARLPTRA